MRIRKLFLCNYLHIEGFVFPFCSDSFSLGFCTELLSESQFVGLRFVRTHRQNSSIKIFSSKTSETISIFMSERTHNLDVVHHS